MTKRIASMILLGSAAVSASQDTEPIVWDLWSGMPPGETAKLSREYDSSGPSSRLVDGRRVTRLTNVSTPTLAIFKPEAEIDTGTAIIIAPGGGHKILAYAWREPRWPNG